MRLYIHDKCMEQLFELPKPIQKKVLEFQRKFRENPKAEAIHLEPISTFKDPNLRTARIDLKYRAIISVPKTGLNYYMIWVDNHDEAMDWAKNKLFEWNDQTQAAQIFTVTEELSTQVEQSSDVTAGLFSDYSELDLLEIGVPKPLVPLALSIQNLNELEQAETYFPPDAFENLFYLSDDVNIEILKAEINEGKKAEDAEESLNNRRFFIEADDDVLSEYLNGDLLKWQIFLHSSQRRLVESSYKSSVKVTGGAGTGKTVVALHRLKYLSSLPSQSDNRKIVFTTFTRSLTQNLIKLTQQMGIEASKFTIINIDAMVKDLALEYGIINTTHRVLDMYQSKGALELWEEILETNLSEFDPKFLNDEVQKVILFNNVKYESVYLRTSRLGRGRPITRKQKMEVWSLYEIYKKHKQETLFLDRSELFNITTDFFSNQKPKPFRFLIADEIQDLSNVELRFIRSLVEEKPNDLFLVGDPYQQIYVKNINFTKAGIHIRGKRSRKLRINYRTTDEIKKLAISAIDGISYEDFDGEKEDLKGYLSLFHGKKPTYSLYKTKIEEIDYVKNLIVEHKTSGLNYKDIALAFRTKDAQKEFKTALHNSSIPYYDINSDSGNPNGVVLSTFHSMKGLEFKAVFLCDVNSRTSPLLFSSFNELDENDKEAYLKSEKSLLYVAISRAINTLSITGTGNLKSEIIKI